MASNDAIFIRSWSTNGNYCQAQNTKLEHVSTTGWNSETEFIALLYSSFVLWTKDLTVDQDDIENKQMARSR